MSLANQTKFIIFSVLSDGHNNYKKRKLFEALFIKEQRPILNEQGQAIPLKLLN